MEMKGTPGAKRSHQPLGISQSISVGHMMVGAPSVLLALRAAWKEVLQQLLALAATQEQWTLSRLGHALTEGGR